MRRAADITPQERDVKLSFHGADRDVTGSCHLIECAGKKILIDCGLFQGSRALAEENANHFGFDPAEIDILLLTHAHLDHCGRLPLLNKRGFRGEIVTTAPTRELTRLVLLDSAHLQEEDARYRAKIARRRGNGNGNGNGNGEPLYTILDALNVLDRFGRTTAYDAPLTLADGVRATFINSGHILGSACILLELTEGGRQATVLFSGDLGKSDNPLLRPPAPPPHADVVIMESTYGDRLHKPMGPSLDEFYDAVMDTFARGGNVLIPTFALERAQELIYFIGSGIDDKRLGKGTQVFLDSPMAISATEIMLHHPEFLQPEVAKRIRKGPDPFRLPGLHYSRESSESMALNRIQSGAIIMAGSGMCTGGRIRHHLKHNLWRPESSIVFVGYAADGTLARRMIDGAKEVNILGEEIPVQARIHTINGFSAHADQGELVAWHKHVNPKRTFLVHGEEKAMRILAEHIHNGGVELPVPDQVVEL
jgi:metallo-beta-lactamase family protein